MAAWDPKNRGVAASEGWPLARGKKKGGDLLCHHFPAA